MKNYSLLVIVYFSFGMYAQAAHDSVFTTSNKDTAQINEFRTIDIGVNLGITNAHTDLGPNSLFTGDLGNQLAYGFTVTKFLSHNFALQARFITGKMTGKDKEKPDQFFFTTKIKYDASINVIFQVRNVSFLKHVPWLAVYGTIGFGEIYFDPGNSWFVEDNLILTDTTHPAVNYHNSSVTIFPIGLGLKFRLDRNFSLSAEYSWRFLYSDKLDGYVRKNSKNDNYSYINIGLIYHAGKKEKVLEWRSRE